MDGVGAGTEPAGGQTGRGQAPGAGGSISVATGDCERPSLGGGCHTLRGD
jgi:hypothetical protein